jgi:hypothetical protein
MEFDSPGEISPRSAGRPMHYSNFLEIPWMRSPRPEVGHRLPERSRPYLAYQTVSQQRPGAGRGNGWLGSICIVSPCVSPMRLPDRASQSIGRLWDRDQVHVIGHEAVGPDLDVFSAAEPVSPELLRMSNPPGPPGLELVSGSSRTDSRRVAFSGGHRSRLLVRRSLLPIGSRRCYKSRKPRKAGRRAFS